MLAQNIMKLLQKYGVNFLNGLGTTLLLALISVSIGCVIGALVAILRLGKSKVLRAVATVYTEVIRDTPLLLQLYFFYFLLPDILPALKLSKFACITIALVINSGAYMSEVFRSGIQSIDRGQTEAARSLGLSARQTMMRITLPQAFKNVLPAMCELSCHPIIELSYRLISVSASQAETLEAVDSEGRWVKTITLQVSYQLSGGLPSLEDYEAIE